MTNINATFAQTTFRGRNDDGSETTATWKAVAGTDWSQNVSEVFRCRFQINQTTSGANMSENIQNGRVRFIYTPFGGSPGSITDVAAIAATTDPIRYASSANVANNDVTTAQIGGSGFVAGRIQNTTTINSISLSGTLPSYTEIEAVLEIYGPLVANGDTIALRYYNSTNQALDAYTDEPIITVVKAGTAQAVRSINQFRRRRTP